MFDQPTDNRLSSWAQHRAHLNQCADPIHAVWDYWKHAPFIPYNNKIDPFYPRNWPTPWEIIVDNRYDDFTRALMIGYSLKWTNRFQETPVEVRTMLDTERNLSYNIVYVDNRWAINYHDSGPVEWEIVPDKFLVENLVELKLPD